MQKTHPLITTIALFAIGGAILAFFGCGPSKRNAVENESKLKILSLEDVQKWNHQMTRKEVVDLVSVEAVLFATTREVMFKAKEGGAYGVSFFRNSGEEPYKVAAVHYCPNYPDDFPNQVILEETPLPNLPVKKGK